MPDRLSFPRTKAREIIKLLDIRHEREIEIESIAYNRKLLIYEEMLEGSDGRLLHNSEKGLARINSNILEQGRKRFTIAHELGHFELHRNSDPIKLCEHEDIICYDKSRPIENDANVFAAELLMPEHLFQPLCKTVKPCFEAISNLADQFRTSLTATAIRYVECSPYSCAIITSRGKTVKWFAHGEDFPYHIKINSELDHNTVASDFFNGKELPSSMEEVIAKAWINSNKIKDNAVVKEQAIALKRYNTVISLVWVEEDIDI